MPGSTRASSGISCAGDLHLQSRPDRRSGHRDAAVSRLWPQPSDRCHRLLELHLHRRCRRALARQGGRGRRSAGAHDTADLGAHRVLGGFPMGPRRGDRLQKAPAQSAPHARGRLSTAVHEKFPLSVVYLTTDAMTSARWRLRSLFCVGLALDPLRVGQGQ
jgi:hypothetical protein